MATQDRAERGAACLSCRRLKVLYGRALYTHDRFLTRPRWSACHLPAVWAVCDAGSRDEHVQAGPSQKVFRHTIIVSHRLVQTSHLRPTLD